MTGITFQQHSMKRGREDAEDGAEDSKHRRLDTDAALDGGDGSRAAEASVARSSEPAADEHGNVQRGSLPEPSRGAGEANGVVPAGEQREARDTRAEPLDGGGADEGAVPGSGAHPGPVQAEEEEDEDLYAPVMPQPQRMRVRKGTECPYLDTISRQVTFPATKASTFLAAVAASPYYCLRCAAAEFESAPKQ